MNSLENIRRCDATRHHVDDVGLGEHRADAGDLLRIVRLFRQRSDLVLGNAKITRDVFQELAGARRALAGHLVVQHLAALVEPDGAAVQGADIERSAAIRAQIDGAAGMSGHGVEMTRMKMQRLALAGRSTIRDVLALQTGLHQSVVVDLFRELQGIALTHAVNPLDEACFTATFDVEERDLDRAGPDIDPRCDRHEILLFQEATARRANSAAPSAPV